MAQSAVRRVGAATERVASFIADAHAASASAIAALALITLRAVQHLCTSRAQVVLAPLFSSIERKSWI